MNDFEKKHDRLMKFSLYAGVTSAVCFGIVIVCGIFLISQMDPKEIARDAGEVAAEFNDGMNGE